MDEKKKQQIVSIIEVVADMTIATVRPDGYPQATTVSYVNDGMSLYFGTSPFSQKARNIAENNKVSLTINGPYRFWKDITGVSITGRANLVSESEEFRKVGKLLFEKFPQIHEYARTETENVALFRIDAEFISLLDYRKGFGHTEHFDIKNPTDD